MKRFGAIMATMIFAMSMMILKIRADAEAAQPSSSIKSEDYSDLEYQFTASENIAAVNAGYKQLWEEADSRDFTQSFFDTASENSSEGISEYISENSSENISESSSENISENSFEKTSEEISQNSFVRYKITDSERERIERIVASEGGYCGYEFQALVASCILNGAEAENMRPVELFDRGDFWLTHNVEPTETTKQAVSDVFDKGIMPTSAKVRYYYNPKICRSELHEKFKYVLTCCDCRFFMDWE